MTDLLCYYQPDEKVMTQVITKLNLDYTVPVCDYIYYGPYSGYWFSSDQPLSDTVECVMLKELETTATLLALGLEKMDLVNALNSRD
jgi:hypothetical protein